MKIAKQDGRADKRQTSSRQGSVSSRSSRSSSSTLKPRASSADHPSKSTTRRSKSKPNLKSKAKFTKKSTKFDARSTHLPHISSQSSKPGMYSYKLQRFHSDPAAFAREENDGKGPKRPPDSMRRNSLSRAFQFHLKFSTGRRRHVSSQQPAAGSRKNAKSVQALAKAHRRKTAKGKRHDLQRFVLSNSSKSSASSPEVESGSGSASGSASGFSSLHIEVPQVDSDDEERRDAMEKTYEFSPNGTFNIHGFGIDQTGIKKAPHGGTTPVTTNIRQGLVLIGRLGKGASGTVSEMFHLPSFRLVAVKSIACFEQRKRHQIIKELDSLYHNLVPLHGSGSETGPPCPYIVAFYGAFLRPNEGQVSIVEEFMDGGSLQDAVDAGGCQSEDVLAKISFCVLKGLEYLHSLRRIHRDIKPSNLLINHRGEVKISDFGIVRNVKDSHGQVNSFVGTMQYMSPERIQGEDYSYSSDIWSFGMSVLTCGLGKFPIPNNGYWGLLQKLKENDAPIIPAGVFSSCFGDFIGRCLERDPE